MGHSDQPPLTPQTKKAPYLLMKRGTGHWNRTVSHISWGGTEIIKRQMSAHRFYIVSDLCTHRFGIGTSGS